MAKEKPTDEENKNVGPAPVETGVDNISDIGESGDPAPAGSAPLDSPGDGNDIKDVKKLEKKIEEREKELKEAPTQEETETIESAEAEEEKDFIGLVGILAIVIIAILAIITMLPKPVAKSPKVEPVYDEQGEDDALTQLQKQAGEA